MSTATLPDLERFSRLALFNAPTVGVDQHEFEVSATGTRIVKAVEIFKAGTFKDSMGDQKTWEIAHLEDMVAHFNRLKAADVLPNVPVRKDHSWSVDSIVGYIHGLSVAGDRLLADIEFTEDDAFDKFERGTYRSRSLEVGMYETNTEDFYWPVVMGLAFVDLPAVEGLHRGSQSIRAFSLAGAPTPPSPKENPVSDFKFRVMGQEHSDFAQVQAYISELEAKFGVERDARVVAESKVATYEMAMQDRKVLDRKAYVTQLAADKKIAAPQVAGLHALVDLMGDDQWAAFEATYSNAPSLAIFGNVGLQHGGEPNAGESDPLAEEVAILEATIEQFKRANLSAEQIAKTPTFSKLQALKSQSK